VRSWIEGSSGGRESAGVPQSNPGWWLRLDNEASACPACGSSRITLLDVFPIRRTPARRRIAFVGGCYACGLLFTNPLPTEEQLRRYYSDEGPWAAPRAVRNAGIEAANLRRLGLGERQPNVNISARGRSLFSALAPYVPVHAPPPGAKVLDFGCGDGKFLNLLQHYGWETYGIEPSSSAAFPRHRHLTSPPQDGTFDFVFLNHVLEHVIDPLGVLRQLAGSLRQGGVLFVSVPRVDTLPQHRDLKYCLSGHRHVVCFSDTCLTGLLARAGLAVTARLDAKELDDAFTEGKPMRLRLVATRTPHPSRPPDAPLAPAVEALVRHRRTGRGFAARMRQMLPVRLRAALMDREMKRQFAEGKRRRREQVDSAGRQGAGG
jgi:SAM-dependent methyltransferase